jgi:hypothetical protein
MRMKIKKARLAAIGILLIFIVTGIAPYINGITVISAPQYVDEESIPTYSARVFLGVIGVRGKEIDGPENYVGPLIDVDFNIVGTDTWVDIWPLFNPLMPISFETDEPIKIHMNYFRGILRNFEGYDHIAGLAYKISWEIP